MYGFQVKFQEKFQGLYPPILVVRRDHGTPFRLNHASSVWNLWLCLWMKETVARRLRVVCVVTAAAGWVREILMADCDRLRSGY